jgi:hypothetical protein
MDHRTDGSLFTVTVITRVTPLHRHHQQEKTVDNIKAVVPCGTFPRRLLLGMQALQQRRLPLFRPIEVEVQTEAQAPAKARLALPVQLHLM